MKPTDNNIPQSGDFLSPDEIPASDPSSDVDKIAELAYYIAERRGFKPGHELDDWLEAERTIASGSD